MQYMKYCPFILFCVFLGVGSLPTPANALLCNLVDQITGLPLCGEDDDDSDDGDDADEDDADNDDDPDEGAPGDSDAISTPRGTLYYHVSGAVLLSDANEGRYWGYPLFQKRIEK